MEWDPTTGRHLALGIFDFYRSFHNFDNYGTVECIEAINEDSLNAGNSKIVCHRLFLDSLDLARTTALFYCGASCVGIQIIRENLEL